MCRRHMPRLNILREERNQRWSNLQFADISPPIGEPVLKGVGLAQLLRKLGGRFHLPGIERLNVSRIVIKSRKRTGSDDHCL